MAYDDRDDDEDDDDDLDIRRGRRRREPSGPAPYNYMTQAVLVTLCCCLPFGIVAIVSASKVATLHASGETEKAEQAANEAKKWCWIGFLLGIPANIIVFAVQVMGT